MYRVLLAADPDAEHAKRAAADIRSLPSARDEVSVTILDVFEEFDVADAGGRVSSQDVFDSENFSEGALAANDALDDIEHELRAEHGDAADQILSTAKKMDADLIAVSGKKRSPAGKAIFGSVTQTVILSADRPVLVARRRQQEV